MNIFLVFLALKQTIIKIMGNSLSEVEADKTTNELFAELSEQCDSVEDLKNQIFGAVLWLIVPKYDNSMNFVEPDVATEESIGYCLPYASSKNQPNNDLVKLARLYYGNTSRATQKVRDNLIEQYVKNRIIDSPEHQRYFFQILTDYLKSTKKFAQVQLQAQAKDDASYHSSFTANTQLEMFQKERDRVANRYGRKFSEIKKANVNENSSQTEESDLPTVTGDFDGDENTLHDT